MDEKRKAPAGGVGEFLPSRLSNGFGLKIVRLRSENGLRNDNFWNEARSIHFYCASVRFLAGSMKIPLAAHYYITKNDPLWKNTDDEEKKIPSLKELFRSAVVNRNGWEQCLDEYVPASKDILLEIYKSDLDADLLMIYPVADGGETTLADYYDGTGKPFSPEDARSLIRQVSATILELYRCGTAHGDIKPENIMVTELSGGRKVFRLTDFGSAHFENAVSDTGTNSFFDRDLYDSIRRKTNSELTARVYTDFYALNHTLLALAMGCHPDSSGLDNEDLVPEKWPGIGDLWEKLLDLDSRTLDDFRELAAGAPAVSDPGWKPFYCFRSSGFEPSLPINGSLEYGHLYEQITFSDQFDPLMRIRGTQDREIWNLFPEFCHIPLIEERYSGLIFHAPDDARTGNPAKDFQNYKPCDLNHIRLTAGEKKRLTGYGKKLNAYFHKNPGAKPFLTRKEDIFRCCGALKMVWGREKNELKAPIDYEAYFRFLATDQAEFGTDDWLVLLPLFPELQDKLDRSVCLKLLDLFRSNDRFAWLFGIESFREQISGEELDFTPRHWIKVRKYTTSLDDRIDFDMAWKIFKAASGAEKKDLQKNSPRIAALLRSVPSPETDAHLYFKDFLDLHKGDRKAFLMYFTDDRRTKFTVGQWEKCLHANPGLIEFAPKEILPVLSRKTWVRILGTLPDRIRECPCVGQFSAVDWGHILLQQPHLKKFCPSGSVIPDKLKKRLTKRWKQS